MQEMTKINMPFHQDDRYLFNEIQFQQPKVHFDPTRQHQMAGSHHQFDEADLLLKSMTETQQRQQWSPLEAVNSSFHLSGRIDRLADIFEPYPLAQPSSTERRSADLKMFLDYVMGPSQPEPVMQTPAIEHQLHQLNNRKRALEEASFAHAPVTAPTSKRSRHDMCHVVELDDESSEMDEALPKFRDYQEQQWQEQYQRLLEFKAKNGHCCVPNTYEPNRTLGRWVSSSSGCSNVL